MRESSAWLARVRCTVEPIMDRAASRLQAGLVFLARRACGRAVELAEAAGGTPPTHRRWRDGRAARPASRCGSSQPAPPPSGPPIEGSPPPPRPRLMMRWPVGPVLSSALVWPAHKGYMNQRLAWWGGARNGSAPKLAAAGEGRRDGEGMGKRGGDGTGARCAGGGGGLWARGMGSPCPLLDRATPRPASPP